MKLVGSERGIRTPELHKKKVRERKIKLTLNTVLFLLLFVLPFVVLRNSHLLIAKVNVTGNNVTSTDTIQKIVESDMNGNFVFVVPKSDMLVYPKKEIESDIITNIPRIDSASVALAGGSTLDVRVTERTPTALYCKDISDPHTPTGCYFIDATGYIFSEAPVFSGDVYHIYTSNPVLDNPIKNSLLTSSGFVALESFVSSLSHLSLTPETITLGQDEDDIMLLGDTTLMWKANAQLDTVYQNLAAFLSDSDIKKNISNLSYIDLRFDNKVFYKFKNE